MANIPDANSYSQALTEGLQIGNSWAANKERKRSEIAEEALRQQQLGVAQQEQAIRNAAAAREAQDYLATQQAQAGLQNRIKELMAPPTPTSEGAVPPEESGATPGQGLPFEQAHRQAMSELLARVPVSQWNRIAPVQQAAAREAYYEGIPEARAKVAETTAASREEVARIRAEWEKQNVEEKARHNKEVEELHKAAAAKGLEPLYDPDTKKFIGYASPSGHPAFVPQGKNSADPIAAALGSAAAPAETTNDIPPVPNSPAEAKVGQSYRLRDGRIGKWNGKTFTIGQ